ncbi:MAG TPA: hypothetical protein VFX10_08490, partial [Nitrospira sp.]|nr:hypothetical protein [Nitrospira sp.]
MSTARSVPLAALKVLPEPELEFRYEQRMHDPHAGLALFGPYSADKTSHPKSLVYGVLGSPQGTEAFHAWSRLMRQAIVEPLEPKWKMGRLIPPDDRKQYLLWPPFPGFQAAFAAEWPERHAWKSELDRDHLVKLATQTNAHVRAHDVVSTYCDALSRAKSRDENFHAMICVIPDEVYDNCRPLSKVKAAGKARVQSLPTPDQLSFSVDFRRQLKGRAMEFGIPIQIVRESTLRMGPPIKGNMRGLTPMSDRGWNLGSVLYYKAGGKPWRLATARKGVCYIGLAFRRTGGEEDRTACCAAQMFLDSGDGIVFKGEFGPWYSPNQKECHLDKANAKQLLAGALKTYYEQGGEELTE